MNVSDLREIIDFVIECESNVGYQNQLNNVNAQLQQLSANPQAQHVQTSFASAINNLRDSGNRIRAMFNPSQAKRIEEVNGTHFFMDDLADEILGMIQANPMAPAAVHQHVQALSSNRQAYITTLVEMRERMSRLGINRKQLNIGDALLGFTIPRGMFDNNLDGLIKELNEIRFIVRAFSEAATGTVGPINVEQISTTDPLFWLFSDPVTVAYVGGAVEWVLETWKKIEEIRKLRSETQKLTMADVGEIVSIFDKKIQDAVKSAVDDKVKDILDKRMARDDGGRAMELGNHLQVALQSLFARVERGMTVEIRFLPSPLAATAADDNGQAEDKARQEAFDTLTTIVPQLTFPTPADEPVLQLPRNSEQSKS